MLLEKILRSKVFIWILIILPGLWPAWPLLRQDPSVLADPAKYLPVSYTHLTLPTILRV